MKIEVYKETEEDWYGSYEMTDCYNKTLLVHVSFCGNISPPKEVPCWRTCVWGTDDCGMEIDCEDEATAFNIFLQIIGTPKVTRDGLKKLGLVSA